MSDTKISEAAVGAASASMEDTKNSLEMTPLDRIRLMLTAAFPHLHPQPAELADGSVIEHIAQQWDGCKYEAPGETLDIGAAIRRAGKRLSSELAEQQGDSPIDVTDPWRGLYQASRLSAPTEYGDTFHPDIPCWPDDREDALDKLVRAQGFDFHIVAGEFTEAALEDGDDLYCQEMRAWNPEAPEGEWRLAWKGDTEDGPYAWFVRPMALRPEPAALAATGKQQVGENPAWRDELVREAHSRGLMEGLNSPRPQQLGEVQGDAHVLVLREMRARLTDAGSPARTSALDAAIAALAARQPGAQVPERRAPVQGYHGKTIPWRVHGLAWEAYARKHPGQDAEKIASRGGFAVQEMDAFLPGWRDMAEGTPAQGIDLGPLRRLYQAYVRLLESGRDRILDFGGTCDPVDVMERTDVDLIEARNLLGIKRDAAPAVGQ